VSMNDDEQETPTPEQKKPLFSWVGFFAMVVLFGTVTIVLGMHPKNDPIEMGLMYLGGAVLVGFLYPHMKG